MCLTSENVLKTVLSLYMEEPSLQLPTMEEVLVCSKETTEEEVHNSTVKECIFKGSPFKTRLFYYGEEHLVTLTS